MSVQWLAIPIRWVVVLGLVGGAFPFAYVAHRAMRGERDREESAETIESPDRFTNGIAELDPDVVRDLGLKEEASRAVSWVARTPAYGRVVPNPQATTELRSPFAGALRAAGTKWPGLGQWLHAGDQVGWIDIRVGPQERLTLRDNLNSAVQRREGARKVVEIQQERVNRLRKVAQSEIVPRQQLDDAEVLLAEAQTQLAVATKAVELWQRARDDLDRPNRREPSDYSLPLLVTGEGEVTELVARPGTLVEAGGLLFQLMDPRRPLVRLDLPPEAVAAGPPAQLRLFALTPRPAALQGVLNPATVAPTPAGVDAALLGPAPGVDLASQYAAYWYAVGPGQVVPDGHPPQGACGGACWRPGLLVKAFVPTAKTESREAVAVPASAVLFHEGKSWVYARLGTDEHRYQRMEVRLLGREGEDWFLEPPKEGELTGIAPGTRIVTQQAQVLLSEEFRPKTAGKRKTDDDD